MIPQLKISDRCIKCDNCLLMCPENSIIKEDKKYTIEVWSCTLCNICVEVCPTDCINLIKVPEDS